MKYQLIAIDLDGTLLHSVTHQITDRNRNAIQSALEANFKIILASGRQHRTIARFAEFLELPHNSLLISYNGAMVKTLAGDLLNHQPVPANLAQDIVKICAQEDYYLNYYMDDRLYIRERSKWTDIYQERTGTVAEIVGDLAKFDGCQPTKLVLIGTEQETDKLQNEFKADFGTSLYITKTEDEYLEFMNSGINKGVALAYSADYLRIEQGLVVAIGDSYNDIPMLQWVGLGAAMANGRNSAKEAADIVIPAADDDGVAQLIETLLRNELSLLGL